MEPFDESLDRLIWSLADNRLKWQKRIAETRRTVPQEIELAVGTLLEQHHAADTTTLPPLPDDDEEEEDPQGPSFYRCPTRSDGAQCTLCATESKKLSLSLLHFLNKSIRCVYQPPCRILLTVSDDIATTRARRTEQKCCSRHQGSPTMIFTSVPFCYKQYTGIMILEIRLDHGHRQIHHHDRR